MKLEAVNSSNIKALGYDPSTRTMQVEFWVGSIYQYEPVTLEAFHALKNADSIGAHFNKHIKDNDKLHYTCIKAKPKK